MMNDNGKVNFKAFDALKCGGDFDPEGDTILMLHVGPDGTVKGKVRTATNDVRPVEKGSVERKGKDGKMQTIRWDDHFAVELGSQFGGTPIFSSENWSGVVKGKVQFRPVMNGVRTNGRSKSGITSAALAARIAERRAAAAQAVKEAASE